MPQCKLYKTIYTSVPMDIPVLSVWLCVSAGMRSLLCTCSMLMHFLHRYHFLELSSLRGTERETQRNRDSRGEERGGEAGRRCILSRFEQAQNKRPVEGEVWGRRSVYNPPYYDSSFTYFLLKMHASVFFCCSCKLVLPPYPEVVGDHCKSPFGSSVI